MAEIGYIVFDGSQQIDTGLYTSGITETEVVFSDFSKSGQYGFVYGGYYDGGRAGGLFCIGSNYEAHVSLGNGEPAAISEDIRAGKITFKLRVDTTNNTGRYQWNNHTPVDFNWSGYYNKQPIQIAGMWRSSKEQMGAFKLYSFKAWQNGTLVRDMRPFRRDSDGTICLYDVVNEQAYLNIWSSQFPDVPSWRVDSSGALTNDEFIEAPEQAIAEPYPDALWRIDPSRNMGLPFCELMIGIIGADFWSLTREHVIRVYDMHEPQDGFDGNGLAVLHPISCVSLQNDDRFDVELRHPLDEWGKWKTLLVNNVLKVSGQLFRIDISEPTLGEDGREIYVHAKHITCDLGDMLITYATFPGGDAADYIDFAFSAREHKEIEGYEYYNFEGYSDITAESGMEDIVNTTVWALMVGADNCLKNKYGGELYRNNFYFSINQRMENAKDDAFYLRYSLDMVDIKQRVDYTNVFTNLICYDNYGNVREWYFVTPTSRMHHPVVKMLQFNYSEPEGAFEKLGADSKAYWEKVKFPIVSYEIQIAALSQDPRYKDFVGLQNYRYGDAGTIYCPELDIETTQRITEVEKDEITGDITRMILGNLRESLARPTYMGNTISTGNSVPDKQNRANQNAMMSQSIAGMELFAISALELREISLFED